MKILITGAAGFLGSHLVKRFLKDGHYVVGIDNMNGGFDTNLPITTAQNFKFHVVDCTDEYKVNLTFERHGGFDIVYHAACYPHEGLSNFSPIQIQNSVLMGTTVTLTNAIKYSAKRFIYMSSMARYGNIQSPYTEDMSAKPVDPYGIAKLAAEETIKNLCETHGMQYVITVPHNIYGEHQNYSDPYRNVVGIFMNKALKKEPLIIYGDGNQKRCFSYIQDNVDPLARVIEGQESKNEIFNIGPDDEFITVNELAEKVIRISGSKAGIEYVNARPREVKEANCSNQKARKLLNYNPQVSLDDGLKNMWEWIKMCGPKPFNYNNYRLEIISDLTPRTWLNKLI